MLKVHKRENFFGTDFGFLSKFSIPMEKWMFFTKKVLDSIKIQGAGVASVHTKYAQQ